jgi:DUF1680 family protein
VAGEPSGAPLTPGTYAEVRRDWAGGETVELCLPMPVRYVEAHPHLFEDRGRVAVLRGPLLFCTEAVDHPDIADLRDLVLPAEASALLPAAAPDDLPGVPVALTTDTAALAAPPPAASWGAALYRTLGADVERGTPASATLIPYYAWANRAPGRMAVWMRRDAASQSRPSAAVE